MARRVLYQFSVKPSGFLASWRFANVVIDDETYVITQEDVPGKEHIGLPCISDYNKVARPYVNDQIVTTFCNMDTFQQITVRAQNCTPFAYATIEADVPACGFLGPVPGPATPPRPWGIATYGAYKFFEYCDRDDRTVRVNIAKRDYSGSEIEITGLGSSPVTISHKDLEEITDPVHVTEMVISLTARQNGEFDDLFTDDGRMFKVTALYPDDGSMKFKGFINPANASEPFEAPPFNVTIRISDGLNSLKNVTYPIPYGSRTNLRQTWVDILAFCFAMTDIDLPIYTQMNLYEAKMLNGLDDDPMAQSTVNPLRFSDDKGNIMSCFQVLEYVGRQFTGYVVQSEGAWQYIRVPELSNPVVRRRKYTNEALFLLGEQTDNLLTLGSIDTDVKILARANIETHGAYKRVVVLQKFGFVPSVIFNGDFEIYDGTNWAYWIPFGGINTTRAQNTVPGVNGAPVLINDYNMQFNARYDLGKWQQPNDIRVNAGDKLSFSFNVGSNSPATIMDWVYLRIILTDGDSIVWLKSPTVTPQQGQLVGVDPVWSTSLETYTVPLGLGPKSIPENIYTVNIPVAPFSGDITIQFFGFVKRENRIVSIGGVLQDKEYPYSPMQIDNVSVAVTNVNNNAIPDGVLYISEQQRFFTQSPDMITVLFGDNVNLFQTTNVTQAANVLRNSISNIFTVDNSFSTLWYEYGLGSDKLPVANWAAKSMLKLYQRPFRIWTGGMLGEFAVVNTFMICYLDNQVYAVMSGDFDMKTKQFNRAVLREMFYKNIPTYNIGTPHNPGQGLPPVFNNPNNPVPVVGTRIFTDEFTQQFT